VTAVPDIRFHPDVGAVDLPALVRGCTTPEQAAELLGQVQRAIAEVIAGPGRPIHDVLPPYKGWHRKKFHAVRRPAEGARADLRLIYRYQASPHGATLRVLATGRRIPGHPDDIYALHQSRPQQF